MAPILHARRARSLAAGSETASQLLELVDTDRARIRGELETSASSALRVLDALARRPVTTAKQVVEASGVTLPTALSTLAALQAKAIVAELTGGKKNRLFAYSGYLDVINRGTELGPPRPRPEEGDVHREKTARDALGNASSIRPR